MPQDVQASNLTAKGEGCSLELVRAEEEGIPGQLRCILGASDIGRKFWLFREGSVRAKGTSPQELKVGEGRRAGCLGDRSGVGELAKGASAGTRRGFSLEGARS